MIIFYSGVDSYIPTIIKSNCKHVNVMFTFWEHQKKLTPNLRKWSRVYKHQKQLKLKENKWLK